MPKTLVDTTPPQPNWNWSPWWEKCWAPNSKPPITSLSFTDDLYLKVFNPATGRFRKKLFLEFKTFSQSRQPVDTFQSDLRNYDDEDIARRAWTFIEEDERRYEAAPAPVAPVVAAPKVEEISQPNWLANLWQKVFRLFR